jgi:hypothetical protein
MFMMKFIESELAASSVLGESINLISEGTNKHGIHYKCYRGGNKICYVAHELDGWYIMDPSLVNSKDDQYEDPHLTHIEMGLTF